MAKFVLIDNSIENTAGHHYQYAAHCLKAAKDLDFTPILAANRVFKPPAVDSDSWQTQSIYHHGFWGARRKREKKLLDLDRSMSTRINFLKYNALFSRIGLTLENKNLLFSQIKLPGIEESVYMSHPRSWIILSATIVPFYILSTRISSSISRFKRRAYSAVTGSSKVDPITGVSIDKETSHIFAQDTAKLFKKIKLEENDILFMPTVGINELLGLAECVQKFPSTSKTSINLLFRRNIYSGRQHDYWKQDEELRLLRNIFTSFSQGLEGHRLFFYTDSDELTMQYNRLGTSSFHTLSLPHTVSPAVKDYEKDKELCITYIGDARTEKGYHHLPHVIQDLWNKNFGAKKIKFIIQSNYNIPKGEPKIVVARSQLESLQNDNNPDFSVLLIYEPLSFEEYIDLLLSSDIVLLPYNENQYYARSSGILVECLAAGIPVIVPSGTWMSRQFVQESCRHNEWLRDRMVAKKIMTEEIPWRRQGSELDPYQDGELVFGGEQTKSYCRLVRFAGSRFLFLSLRINAPYLSAIKIDLAQLRYDETLVRFGSFLVEKMNFERNSLILPLDGNCEMLWLGFKSAFSNSSMSLSDIEIAFLSEREKGEMLPFGSVGLSYDNPDQIPDLLSDMLNHHSHYRGTALEFSKDYSKTHNAKRLIQRILEVSNENK